MTDKQPEALRLAKIHEEGHTTTYGRQAAAELRRLHEVNAELVEALTDLVNEIGDGFIPHKLFIEQSLAAIRKAQGDNNEV